MTSITKIYIGKVRNSVSLNNETRIIETSNRISAFDYIFPFQIEKKAEILQAISVWYFNKTSHIIENNLIGCLDETHVLVKEAKVFPVEIIVRSYLTGSLWRLYQEKGAAGVFTEYGINLPENMTQNQKFSKPIITPSTKAETGHDLPISCEKASEIIGKENWNLVEKKAIELFLFGEQEALNRGLILVDTKYEMGLYQNRIILVDEVHTPDSSRYWIASGLNLLAPKQMSKEFLREELIKIIGKPEEYKENPANHPYFKDTKVTAELSQKISQRYNEMFQTFVGEKQPKEICDTNLVPWPISKELFKETINSATMPENILVIGNGGRDFTIYSSFSKLPEVNTVFCAAGKRNWHSAKYAECPTTQVQEIAKFAKENKVGLVIAGPENPIAQGIEEYCSQNHIPVLAPSLNCASLEASKIICKEVIKSAGVQTAKSEIINWNQLKIKLNHYLEIGNSNEFSLPCVLKYDSLAAGKGVFVLFKKEDVIEAIKSIEQNLQEWEKLASQIKAVTYSKTQKEPCFLIEETLSGEEISVIALCNGENYRLLPIARDYKRRNDGQTGPNTGGMGTVSPVQLNENLMTQIKETFSKTLKELTKRNTPYYGFLFAGFMVDSSNKAWLLEYNCRLGDPETQVLLPGLQRDFYIEVLRTAKKLPFLFPEKSQTPFDHDNLKRIFVVGASPEYPESNVQRREIIVPNESIFISSNCYYLPTAIEPDNTTTGGRAFGVLSTATNFKQARENVYKSIEKINFKDSNGNLIKPHFRTDIAKELC
ncbi:ATP-grasp domain-containing protein [Silvanigrella paludirubra]|uniref:Phosphoribosylaminoimidazole-succinocarboxamide synthase n=1 Tax=Silvanigrella paludirubra TaxID=2499159 RepID=A0A6N6VNG0_9BACT|nr:phosphoribosylaminoimidazolesuccinocarboxamide synthase [Silvanigrella paludirubra]KAB8036479.1 ATP-grasp domain-containing protein [Silvanigrella paludirubra]